MPSEIQVRSRPSKNHQNGPPVVPMEPWLINQQNEIIPVMAGMTAKRTSTVKLLCALQKVMQRSLVIFKQRLIYGLICASALSTLEILSDLSIATLQ